MTPGAYAGSRPADPVPGRRRGAPLGEARPGAASFVASTVALLVALALLAHPAAAQCPMCRTALESPEGAVLASAFRRAILFLLAVPFVSVAVIAVSIAREARRRVPPPPTK